METHSKGSTKLFGTGKADMAPHLAKLSTQFHFMTGKGTTQRSGFVTALVLALIQSESVGVSVERHISQKKRASQLRKVQ